MIIMKIVFVLNIILFGGLFIKNMKDKDILLSTVYGALVIVFINCNTYLGGMM